MIEIFIILFAIGVFSMAAAQFIEEVIEWAKDVLRKIKVVVAPVVELVKIGWRYFKRVISTKKSPRGNIKIKTKPVDRNQVPIYLRKHVDNKAMSYAEAPVSQEEIPKDIRDKLDAMGVLTIKTF